MDQIQSQRLRNQQVTDFKEDMRACGLSSAQTDTLLSLSCSSAGAVWSYLAVYHKEVLPELQLQEGRLMQLRNAVEKLVPADELKILREAAGEPDPELKAKSRTLR